MMKAITQYSRIVVTNIVLVIVLVVLVLGVIETYLRLTIPASSGGSIYDYTLTTKLYKVMKPDTRIVAWGSELRTNRLGFRDSKSEVAPKVSSEFRIIVLGDSFTVSAGVDFNRIYTSLVESGLRSRFPDVRVLNLAVGGYNIIQYRLVLEEVGRRLKPDLIVVGVFPFNDLSNDTYRANQLMASGRSVPSTSAWYQRSYVYRAYGSRVESRLKTWFGPHRVLASTPVTADTGPQDNLGALQSIFDTAAADGTPAVAALLPNTDSLEQQQDQFAPFVEFCREHALPCLNLLPVFASKGVNGRALVLNQLDSHPNSAYHVVVADALTEYLAPLIEPTPRVELTNAATR
jgi:lysophospholipase L1-like esterase